MILVTLVVLSLHDSTSRAWHKPCHVMPFIASPPLAGLLPNGLLWSRARYESWRVKPIIVIIHRCHSCESRNPVVLCQVSDLTMQRKGNFLFTNIIRFFEENMKTSFSAYFWGFVTALRRKSVDL
jgi:hypothetical protein